MQWVTIITYCLEDEAASGKAEAAVANRGPVSQRRRRRGALPNFSHPAEDEAQRGGAERAEVGGAEGGAGGRGDRTPSPPGSGSASPESG